MVDDGGASLHGRPRTIPIAAALALLALASPASQGAPLSDLLAPVGATACEQMTYGVGGCERWSRIERAAPGHRAAGLTAVVSPDGARLAAFGTVGGDGGVEAYGVAYDPDDGLPQWISRYSGGHGQDAAIAAAYQPGGERIFLAGETWGRPAYLDWPADALLYAVDAATGRILWSHVHVGSADGYDQLDEVLVTPDGTRVLVQGSVDGGATRDDIYTAAHDAATGQRLWHHEHDSSDARQDTGTQLVLSPDGATVYSIGSSYRLSIGFRYVVLAYDVGSGARRWIAESPFLGAPLGAATAPGAPLVIGGTNGLWALDPATGAEVWRRADPLVRHVQPAGDDIIVLDDRVFPARFRIARIDGHTGATLWSHDELHPQHSAWTAALSPDGSTYVAAGTALHAFDAATGSRLWSVATHDDGAAAPVRTAVFAPDGRTVFTNGELHSHLLAPAGLGRAGTAMFTQAIDAERVAGAWAALGTPPLG